jgi:DNA invertase Pin-like site-specific DNA recombinase
MSTEHGKVRSEHLNRKAFLYVCQSSIRQVFENTESTARQYALGKKATALGWPDQRTVVIDDDLGRSAASGSEREGFQRLVAEVGMGHAGIVIGLEVSRLARSCSDWHKLLEICGLTGTLIMDEDGLYDPTLFNDRLVLGLKGTMSEAELHVLRARLRGGMLNKARRGELVLRLPVGFVRDGIGRVVLDPDQQVRQVVGPFFDTFSQLGTAQGTVRAFRVQNIKFPKRLHGGADKGKLTWGPLTTSPFPITISTTPGAPVLTAVRNQCRGAGTPFSFAGLARSEGKNTVSAWVFQKAG